MLSTLNSRTMNNRPLNEKSRISTVLLDELSKLAGHRAAILVDPSTNRAEVVRRDDPSRRFDIAADLAARVSSATPVEGWNP